MRVAHLVRIDGVLDDARAVGAVDTLLAEIRARHERWCAAVEVDLTTATALAASVVPRLCELRQAGLERHVSFTVRAPRGSAAFRVLDFHDGLGLDLPPVSTQVLG